MNKNLKNGFGFHFFATTLNVILERERSELPRGSRNIMAIFFKRMYHPGHSANLFRSKPSVTGNCAGRSMIEMLGVLAIIAVLSVGGIAGYSKAMLMWKSNIQRNMIGSLLNSTIKLKMYLPRQTSKGENITHLLSDLGEVPEGVEYKNNNLYSKDGFTSYIYYGLRTLTSRDEEHKVYQQNQYTIYFLFYQGGKSFNLTEKEFCNNLLTVSKEFAGEIKEISFWKTDSNSGYGDSGVNLYTGRQLKKASFAEMRQTCDIIFTETGQAHFNIVLKYD